MEQSLDKSRVTPQDKMDFTPDSETAEKWVGTSENARN